MTPPRLRHLDFWA